MRTSLRPGLWFGLAGFLCAIPIFVAAKGAGWGILIPTAGLAAFLVGATVWWLLVERPRSPSIWRGLVAGALTGLLSHPLAWYLLVLANFFFGSRSSLGDPPADPLIGLQGALYLTFFSLLFFGWLTASVGALLGALLGWRARRHPPADTGG